MSLLDRYIKKKDEIEGIQPSGGLLIDRFVSPETRQVIEKTPEKPGLLRRIGKGIAKFATRTGIEAINLATSTLDFTADLLSSEIQRKIKGAVPGMPVVGKPTEIQIKIADRWKSFYKRTGGAGTEKLKSITEGFRDIDFIKPSEDWQKASTKEKLSKKMIGETLLNIGPGVVSSIGAFAINPVLGFTFASGSVADEIKTIGVESGLDEEKAEYLGLGTGIVVGFIDKIVPDELFSPQGKKKFISGVVKRAVKMGLKEAGTEMVQEDVQLLVESTLRDDITMDEIISRNVMAGLGGLMGGVGAGGITTYVNNIRSGDIAGIEPGIDIKDVREKGEVRFQGQVQGELLGEDTVVFRGAKDQAIDVTRKQGITDGVSFSIDETMAQKFADKVDGTVTKNQISAEARVINLSDLEKVAVVKDAPTNQKNEAAVKYIKDNAIDVVRVDVKRGALSEGELIVVNEGVLKGEPEVEAKVEEKKPSVEVKIAEPEIEVSDKGILSIKRGEEIISLPKTIQDNIIRWNAGENIGVKKFGITNDWLSKYNMKLGKAGENLVNIKPKEVKIITKEAKPPKKVEPKKPKKKVEPKKPKKKVVKVPERQLPVGEGEEKVSRLGARMKGALKNATQTDIEELGLTTYRQMNQDSQIARASEIAINNTKDAFRMVRGEIDPPKGVLQNSIFAALVELGKVDTNVATQIATLTATRFGQEINILKKILADNPVVRMQDIVATRVEAYEKKRGVKVEQRVKAEIKKIDNETKAPDKAKWESFLKDIRC